MPIMNPILRYAIYPFARVVELTRPKKKDPEKKSESKKEDKKVSKNVDAEALKIIAAAENDNDSVLVHASGLDVILRGHEYKIRITKPAHGARESELQTSLKRNRNLLDKSVTQLQDLYRGNVKKNKDHNQLVEDIQKGVIKPENDKMKAAFAKVTDKGTVKLDAWDETYLRLGTQNALVARANIDLLIPLINMRGGEAEYKGMESWPIYEHINKMRDNAANLAREELIPPPEPPKTDAWTIQEFITAAIIIIIITLMLWAFM